MGLPSPKFHLHSVISPVDLSVNLMVSGARPAIGLSVIRSPSVTAPVKAAVGAGVLAQDRPTRSISAMRPAATANRVVLLVKHLNITTSPPPHSLSDTRC